MERIRIALLSDNKPLISTLRLSIPEPHELSHHSLASFLDENCRISKAGEAAFETIRAASCVLVPWRLENAAAIGALSHRCRSQHRIPLFAICGSAQEEAIAAITAGADYVATMPVHLPNLMSKIAAYRRLVAAAEHRVRLRLRKDLGEYAEESTTKPEPRPPVVEPSRPKIDPGLLVDATRRLKEEVRDSMLDLLDDSAPPKAGSLSHGDLVVDGDVLIARVGRRTVELTPKEFNLLKYLVDRNDQTCSRNDILDAVWGIDFDTGTNMVDVYIHFLRRKLESVGLSGAIRTIRGRGYRVSDMRLATPAAGS